MNPKLKKYEIAIKNMLKTKPQNTKGSTILGILRSKNDVIDHCLPNDKAPASIKNKSTPTRNPLFTNTAFTP